MPFATKRFKIPPILIAFEATSRTRSPVHRALTYMTVFFTLMLPVFGALWARSFIHTETFYRVGNGHGLMLNCTQGEVAIWAGPARASGPVRWGHESSSEQFGLQAQDSFAMDPTAQGWWLAGFGYAQTFSMAPPHLGPVRCYVFPLWFLTVLVGLFPARVLARHVKKNQAAVEAEAACCRRCGEPMQPGETHCHACSFPAFIRRGVVA